MGASDAGSPRCCKKPMLLRKRLALRPITKKQKQPGILKGAHLGGVIGQ